MIVYLGLNESYNSINLFILLYDFDDFIWPILAQRMDLVLHKA